MKRWVMLLVSASVMAALITTSAASAGAQATTTPVNCKVQTGPGTTTTFTVPSAERCIAPESKGGYGGKLVP